MATYQTIDFEYAWHKAKLALGACWSTKSTSFKYRYWSFLCLMVCSLVICLWSAIQLGIIQQQIYQQLASLSPAELASQYPVFDPLNESVWLIKGLGPYAWYLTAIDDLGRVAYWCVIVFTLVCVPLLIYYLSSFLIVVFPKQAKKRTPPTPPTTGGQ